VAPSASDPALSELAFSLKPGEWSQPIVTSNGVHLIRVKERREPLVHKFAEVKGAIIEEEADKLRKRATEDEITKIRTSPRNTVYADRVKALQSEIDMAKVDKVHRDAIDKIQSQH